MRGKRAKGGESGVLIMVKSNFGGNPFYHKARRKLIIMIQNWPIKVTVSPETVRQDDLSFLAVLKLYCARNAILPAIVLLMGLANY